MRLLGIVMLLMLSPVLVIGQGSENGETVNFKDLLQKEGKYYKFGATEPFTGQCIEYHSNEMPKNVAYVIDGKLEGRFVSYDTFGNKTGEARYVGGVRQGTETHYYPSGKKKREVTFDKGKMHGTFIEYDEKGLPVKSAEYKQGEIMSKTRYEGGKAVDTRHRSIK